MFIFKKVKLLSFLFFLLTLFVIPSFATSVSIDSNTDNWINKDLYISEDTYSLDKVIDGNVFATCNNFTINPRHDGGSITGNLFVTSDNVKLESDLVYSNDNSRIEKINSTSKIYGNVFVVSKSFTLEPGCEIDGDLFIVSKDINISNDAIIYGSIFVVGSNVNINCKIGGSLYVHSQNFNMDYFGSVAKNLNLDSETAYINGVINRNACINSNSFTSDIDFYAYGDFELNSNDSSLCGSIDGNAYINSKKLQFKDGNFIINKNLNYSSKDELSISEDIVKGNIDYSKFVEKTNFIGKLGNSLLSIAKFIVYIFVVCIIIKLVLPNYFNFKFTFSIKDILISFGIGLALIVATFICIILLLISHIGISLAFVLLFGYAFLMLISIPMFALPICNTLAEKFKLNKYLSILLFALCFGLVNLIPYIGSVIFVLFVITGSGKMVVNMFIRK